MMQIIYITFWHDNNYAYHYIVVEFSLLKI